MKISYIFQLKDFSIMILFGFFLGIFYGILNIPNFIKEKFYIRIIADIIFSIVSIILLLILTNKINLGEHRLYLIIGYVLGFVIERNTLGKLFAKGYKNVYNHFVIILKKFINSKIGRFIFK